MSAEAGFSADEQALLDETAAALVRRRLAVPAMMALEVLSPMNVVTASMLHVLTPLLSIALPTRRVRQVATLLERRSAIPALVDAIDAAEERRRRDERRERAERPPRRRWPRRRRAAPPAEPRTPPRGEPSSESPPGSAA